MEYLGELVIKDPDSALDISYIHRVYANFEKQKIRVELIGSKGKNAIPLENVPILIGEEGLVDVFDFLKELFEQKKKRGIQNHSISQENIDRLKSIIVAREL